MWYVNQARHSVNGRAWSSRLLLVFAMKAVAANLTGRAQVSHITPKKFMHRVGAFFGLVNKVTRSFTDRSTEPILRIEAGQHGAAINRIDTDAANRFAVTASDDKTVRVWSLPDGRLLRTLRLPIDIDNTNIGKAYAVALSPDGNTVAVGGWTTVSGAHGNIFLFDRASRELKQRFGDLPNVVYHLAYSADGRRLAVSLADYGIRVFDAGNGYRLLPSDTQYKDSSWSAMFDLAGRLATTSNDGFVRLYAADKYAAPIAKFESKGHQPYAAAFSPDGTRVAVGHLDVNDVVVLSGSDLTQLFKANTAGIPTNVNLAAVGWSQDGPFVFAGGTWQVNNVRQVRRWSNGGRGASVDIPTASQSITEILGLKAGSMLFAHTGGFGLISPDAKVMQLQGISGLDLASGGGRTLRISADGGAVQVGSWEPKHTYRFALARRVIDIDPPADGALLAPIMQASGLAVANWSNSATPAVNETPIKLEANDVARSIAIVPGTQHFVLGTSFSLRLVDRQGQDVWPKAQPVPGEAWHVNVTADGTLVVAAYDDGTIRWHRLSDGKELLALFIHPDGQRWIAWTPQGYYDASLGADELIGWHVNQGRDRAPDFYPASQFRSQFYRPDVIQRVLRTPNLDIEEAVRDADKEAGRPSTRDVSVSSLLTPVVQINDPKNPAALDRTDLTLGYSVQLPSPDDSLRVEALVDGVKVPAEDRPLVPSGLRGRGTCT